MRYFRKFAPYPLYLVKLYQIKSVLNRGYYKDGRDYANENKDDIVVDYLASMTDDYFIDLYKYLFPKGKYSIKYVPYFEI